MTAAVDLVGPKGYVHGWIFEGIPSPGSHISITRPGGHRPAAAVKPYAGSVDEAIRKGSAENVDRGYSTFAGEKTRVLRQGDRVMASFGGGVAGFRPHTVMSVVHGRDGKSRMTLRDDTTGRMHPQTVRSTAGVTMARGTKMIDALTAARKAAAAKGQATRRGVPQPPHSLQPHRPLARASQFAVHPSETAGGRKSALRRGLAIPPPSKGAAPGFPVTDAAHWDKARQAIGRVKNPKRRAQVAALLRRTAARFGKTKALGESWAAHANPMEMTSMAPARFPVSSPYDLIITRGDDGAAVVRHRRGGGEITRLRRDGDGRWVASTDGRDGQPHVRQRGALLEAIGRHNLASGTPYHRPAAPARTEPLQPEPVQTPLMQKFGIPAIRANLANSVPAVGASDGSRETGGANGLSDRGSTIYKKLRSRGFPHARAHAFARRAQNKVRGGK